MDNTEDDAIYPQRYESSQHPKLHVRSVSNPEHDIDHDDDIDELEDDDDEEMVEVEEEIRPDGQMKGIVIGADEDDDVDEDDYTDTDDDLTPNGYSTRRIEDVESQKKRKLENLLSRYEFAPRAVQSAPVSKPSSHGGRNALTDWTEHETFVLLDAWGERFLKHNRKSVRFEEWQAVAEKVSGESKITRTETQCRNRVDTLKKKYKKEKLKLSEGGESGEFSNKWVYFSKMDMLMSPSPQLANGYVNVLLDETKDSLGDDSEFTKGENDDLEELLPKKTKMGKDRGDGDAFKLLADSINKFSDMYEKIETSKREQLVELEKMRMDFQRDLELQKRKILKRAHLKMAKIWHNNDGDDNDSLG